MIPLLKSYVGVASTDDGVYVQAGERNFVIAGKNLFPLISKLLAAFDGRTSLPSIAEALPASARPLLDKLVGELKRHRMIHLLDSSGMATVAPDLEREFKSTLAFLRDQHADYQSIFLAWRDTEMTVVGGGHSFEALVRALLKSGVRRLRLALECGAPLGKQELLDVALRADLPSGIDTELIWLPGSASAFLPLLAQSTGRVLYANDLIPWDQPSSLFAIVLRDSPVRILAGGIFCDRGLVGPEMTAGGGSLMDSWLRVPHGDAEVPHSIASCSIIGALMAFEALKSMIFEREEGERYSNWSQRHFFHITPGAEITTHQQLACAPGTLETSPARREVPGASRDAWVVTERRRLEANMAAAFDPLTGMLAWSEAGHAEFPLPHCAVQVTLPGSGADRALLEVLQWGLTPQDVGLRVLCLAVAASADWLDAARLDRQQPLTASPLAVEWRRAALAHGIARSSLFAQQGQTQRIAIDSIGDPGFQMLVRLSRLYTESLPEVCIRFVPGLPAFVAEARVGIEFASAAGASALEALVESLGLALSLRQCPQRARGADVRLLYPLAPLRAGKGQPAPLSRLEFPERAMESFAYEAVEHRLDPALFSHSGMIIGFIELRLRQL